MEINAEFLADIERRPWLALTVEQMLELCRLARIGLRAEAEVERLRAERDKWHGMVAEHCRNTPGACFCGCHTSYAMEAKEVSGE